MGFPQDLPSSLNDRLAWFTDRIEGQVVFTTSFGLEDQAISHAILTNGFNIEIITLDTGRLFLETLEVWAETETKYGRKIQAALPRVEDVESLLNDQGALGFKDSLENRKRCCAIRKVEPLARVLKDAGGWITGIRSDQSDGRNDIQIMSEDATHNLLKFNPLIDWSREQVVDYIAEHNVPYNSLHDKGFPSIGCQPCTRAVEPGEPERSGRWWWENEGSSECGLHVNSEGRLVRIQKV